VTSARYGSPWLRYRDGTIYRGEQTLAQAPTSLSMPGRDGVEEKFKGEVPYTERSAMKVFVNAVIPESPGAVDVHISLRDLRPGQEMSVAQAFSSIESALADGKDHLL
jgi:hypothetical protein